MPAKNEEEQKHTQQLKTRAHKQSSKATQTQAMNNN
jgi:hypothetical protein